MSAVRNDQAIRWSAWTFIALLIAIMALFAFELRMLNPNESCGALIGVAKLAGANPATVVSDCGTVVQSILATKDKGITIMGVLLGIAMLGMAVSLFAISLKGRLGNNEFEAGPAQAAQETADAAQHQADAIKGDQP